EHLTVDSIKQCVAQYYNLSVAQINSKSRTNNIIIARHIAMYLVRNLIKDISYIQIGKEFGGRDHSTVMKACSKVDKNIKKDPNYRQAIEEIKAKLI
ncbi:MAG: chromosomal replication initiator protein DnaA, partial [Erysipelotrichaceae bacterium]|nr:chromosomal replication initiator protein DnaA [Erysipelotrichaceae bacterium]